MKPYAGHSKAFVANGRSLDIQCLRSSIMASKSSHVIFRTHNDVLYVPYILRNMLYVSTKMCLNLLLTNAMLNLKFLSAFSFEYFQSWYAYYLTQNC